MVDPIRVLIVDDHEPFRRAVAAIVSETDDFVVVGSAASGEQSFEVFDQTPADLVLMDVNLPAIDGIAAARRLTARPDAPVVVLLSTYDDTELDFHDCGAVAYLNKAVVTPSLLLDIWRTAAT